MNAGNTDPSGAIIGAFGVLWLLLAVGGIAASIFWIVELIDAVRREFRDPTMKIIWILLIVFTHFLGSILYYLIGKGQGTIPGEGQRRI